MFNVVTELQQHQATLVLLVFEPKP